MQPPRLTLIQGGADKSAIDNAAFDPAAGPGVTPTTPETTLETTPEATRLARPVLDDTAPSMRIIEALLFAASEPIDEAKLVSALPANSDIKALLAVLQDHYASRGVNLVTVGGRWAFRTATDLGYLLQRYALEEKKLSKAALETLSIIAYHQPVTRAEIEDIRGVSTSKGTLDVLMETGWVRPRGRRRAPGKPITYGTTPGFLDHFGLATIKDLPGLAELKGAGLLDANLPPDFRVPEPTDVAALLPDELPLDSASDDETPLELPFADDTPEHDNAEDDNAEDRKAEDRKADR